MFDSEYAPWGKGQICLSKLAAYIYAPIQIPCMMNLKKFFLPNPCLLSVTKAEKELLEYFAANKQAFEEWLSQRPPQRVRFRFYFPTAIDFYFDDFLLFTAYFRKPAEGTLLLQEFKMSQANFTTIRSANWKPFEEEVLCFLRYLEEKNKIRYFQKTSALHEYVAICEKTCVTQARPAAVNAAMLTGC